MTRMPARLRPGDPAVIAAALARRAAETPNPGDARLLVKHFLAVLALGSPGGAVEVRVPPYAVAQCLTGTRHTRGTPPAVVETDAETWVALALGELTWEQAEHEGRLVASGERSDLSALLPLSG